jgi:hypothetical protein
LVLAVLIALLLLLTVLAAVSLGPGAGVPSLLFAILLLLLTIWARQRHNARIRRLWRTVPVYRQLLKEYPSTKMIVDA